LNQEGVAAITRNYLQNGLLGFACVLISDKMNE